MIKLDKNLDWLYSHNSTFAEWVDGRVSSRLAIYRKRQRAQTKKESGTKAAGVPPPQE